MDPPKLLTQLTLQLKLFRNKTFLLAIVIPSKINLQKFRRLFFVD